jgi:vitamin B12 transporter
MNRKPGDRPRQNQQQFLRGDEERQARLLTPPLRREAKESYVPVRRLILVLVLVFTALAAFAQQPPTQPSLTQSPQEEARAIVRDEIVVTASGTPENVETTPAAATVITRAEIDRREARDVVEMLREVPGVTTARTGSPGKVASVFTRGGNSTHTLVMWNGIKLNSPYFSGYNWGQLSTAGIDKIEVVPGPYSALYGADAVTGVVNILSMGARNGLQANAEAGEKGLRNGLVSGAYSTGAWSLNAAAEHRDDDGFAANDDYRQGSLLGGATYAPRPNFSIGVLARHATYDLGVPFNVNAASSAFVPTPNRRQDGSELQIGVPIRFDLGPVRYDVSVSSNRRKDNITDPDEPYGLTFSRTDSRTHRAFATARSATRLGTITLGGEYERATVSDVSAYGSNLDARRRSSKALFLEDRLSLPLHDGSAVEMTVGLRRDQFDLFGSETAPRLAAAWVRSGVKIRAAYGRAFRAPYLGELYFPFFGNADLKAEHSRSTEVGFDRYFGGGSSASVTLFHNDFRNEIVYDNLASKFANVGRARSQGVEIGADRRWAALSVAGSYTYQKADEEPANQPLLRRPRHSGSLAVGYDAGKLQSQLVVAYKGRRDDVTDLFPFGRVTNASYTTADVTLHVDLGSFVPYVKVENLTDEQYQDVFGYPSARRRASVGLRYSLH